jgi:hypothetical protein
MSPTTAITCLQGITRRSSAKSCVRRVSSDQPCTAENSGADDQVRLVVVCVPDIDGVLTAEP